MKRILAGAALAAASVNVGGCATIMNGTHQDVMFQSEPEGAVIKILGGRDCKTPCELEMKRGRDAKIAFDLPGYRPEYVYVQSRLGGSTFGNIIAGGAIGGVLDVSNGASNRLYPRPVYIRLVPESSSDEAMLLDKDGEVISTVAAHNSKVEKDVRKGLEEQGLLGRDVKD